MTRQDRLIVKMFKSGASQYAIGKACGHTGSWGWSQIQRLGLRRETKSPAQRVADFAMHSEYRREHPVRIYRDGRVTDAVVIDDGKGNRTIKPVRS